jgi:hypothetical protein
VAFLFEEMAAAITARRLETPLDGALSLDPEEHPRVAAKRLADNDFDQAPVCRGEDLEGFALRRTLEITSVHSVAQCTVPLTPAVLVSADAGLPSLLPVLATNAFTFVLHGHVVSGFVTPSDLNKQLARTHFFLLLASLEVMLGGLIRATYPDLEIALGTLTPKRSDAVQDRLRRDEASNVALDLVAEMEFADLLRVVAGTERLRAVFSYPTRRSFLAAARHLPDLRNDVMHPSREFLGGSRDVAKLIGIEQELRALITAAADEVGRTDPWLAASLTA